MLTTNQWSVEFSPEEAHVTTFLWRIQQGGPGPDLPSIVPQEILKGFTHLPPHPVPCTAILPLKPHLTVQSTILHPLYMAGMIQVKERFI